MQQLVVAREHTSSVMVSSAPAGNFKAVICGWMPRAVEDKVCATTAVPLSEAEAMPVPPLIFTSGDINLPLFFFFFL